MNTKTFSALAEPNRLRIIELLRDQPHSVNSIAQELSMRQPQASKHLNTLSKAGLVTARPVAQRRIYALNPGPLTELNDWLGSFENFWNKRFSALGEHIKKIKEQ